MDSMLGKVDVLFLLFILLVSFFIVGGTYFLFASGRQITSFIYFGGFMAIAIIYGLQWFRSDGSLNQAAVTIWPPVINMCPDFLSLTTLQLPKSQTDTTLADTYACVDTLGVSKGILSINTANLTGENTYFPLYLNETDDAARSASLCDECRRMGVTWDGIFDGVSCLNGTAPRPVKSVT